MRRRRPRIRGANRPHRARGVQWIAIALLAGATIVLGVVGFQSLNEDEADWSFWDSLYGTIQLFVLESGSVEEGSVPLALNIARLLAPLLATYAAVLAVTALFREELRRLAHRLRARDHVVVAGLGEKGFRLARHFAERGTRVVALERDPATPAVTGARERGILVLEGDAEDPELLERAALARARYLFAVCGDDGTNVDIAFTARAALEREPRGPCAFVHLGDVDLWRHLAAGELAGGPRPSVRIEFFNLADAAARMLVERHPPFAPGEAAPHVVLCGVEEPAESVVLHAAGGWLSERGDPTARLRLTVCGPDAHAGSARLLARHPDLDRVCDVRTGPERPDPGLGPDDPAPTAAYVCARPEAAAVAHALALRAAPALDGVPVVVAVRDETEGIATALRPDGGVVPFAVLGRALTSELVALGTEEVIARAKHAQYVRDELAHGGTAADNPSIAAWDDLDESLRESNRDFARGVGDKLAAAGLTIVPAPLADPRTARPILAGDEVEELAILEHDRWCADLRARGWQPTDGPKDPQRKLHPSLVTWDDLPEEERDKDREPVRALPEMLAHVGFELRRARTAGAAAAERPAGAAR